MTADQELDHLQRVLQKLWKLFRESLKVYTETKEDCPLFHAYCKEILPPILNVLLEQATRKSPEAKEPIFPEGPEAGLEVDLQKVTNIDPNFVKDLQKDLFEGKNFLSLKY